MLDINNIFGVFLKAFVVGAVEWRTGKSNESCSCGFEDSEGGDEFHEGVNSDWFCGAFWMSVLSYVDSRKRDLHFYDTAICADI